MECSSQLVCTQSSIISSKKYRVMKQTANNNFAFCCVTRTKGRKEGITLSRHDKGYTDRLHVHTKMKTPYHPIKRVVLVQQQQTIVVASSCCCLVYLVKSQEKKKTIILPQDDNKRRYYPPVTHYSGQNHRCRCYSRAKLTTKAYEYC